MGLINFQFRTRVQISEALRPFQSPSRRSAMSLLHKICLLWVMMEMMYVNSFWDLELPIFFLGKRIFLSLYVLCALTRHLFLCCNIIFHMGEYFSKLNLIPNWILLLRIYSKFLGDQKYKGAEAESEGLSSL